MDLQPNDLFKRNKALQNMLSILIKSYNMPISKNEEKEFLKSFGDYIESNGKCKVTISSRQSNRQFKIFGTLEQEIKETKT